MAYLVIIACMAATHDNCKEFPLPEVTAADVSVCNYHAKKNAQKWQKENPDYLVIGTKCIKAS